AGSKPWRWISRNPASSSRSRVPSGSRRRRGSCIPTSMYVTIAAVKSSLSSDRCQVIVVVLQGLDRNERSRGMSGVRVLVGTRKGAFVLTSDGKRRSWDVGGPFFGG